MNKDQFWDIIDSVNRSAPAVDQDTFLRSVTETLCQYPVADIMDWHLILEEYRHAAYRDNLWSASASIGAHSTDDGFIDFRCWLISRGKEAYMNALRNPDSLSGIPLNGERPNFELFGYTASAAYDAKLYKHAERPVGLSKLYDELETYTLDPQTVRDIRAEIPPGQIIGQDQNSREQDSLGESDGGEVREPQNIAELLETEQMVVGYVYAGGQCSEYIFHHTPENVASFLGSHPEASRMILTDAMDQLILNTIGNFIDRCPDQDLLGEIQRALVPIQRGEAEARTFFCPSREEVDEYCDRQLEQEMESGQMMT